jgi:hypothetical protein
MGSNARLIAPVGFIVKAGKQTNGAAKSFVRSHNHCSLLIRNVRPDHPANT